MKVGLAYDLRDDYLKLGFSKEETAEFDKPETIAGIESSLRALGHETERIGHGKALVSALAAGKRWDLVFNIAEGMVGLGRESLVPCLCEAYQIPYTFSDPMVLALSLHKGMCKRVIRDLGVPTADFHVVETQEDLARVDLPFPLFVKPVAEGTGKGISDQSLIRDRPQLVRVCLDLLARFQQPVLVETFLSGREFTVGVVGTGPAARVVGGMEVLFNQNVDVIYSYDNKENYEEKVRYRPIDEPAISKPVYDVAIRAWRGLCCRDGGRVDIRMDAQGQPMFIEVNPLAGLNPVHSDLPILARLAGWDYGRLIGEIMESAIQRASDARTHRS